MAFYDDLARDPTIAKEFWEIAEETFVQVEGVLTTYQVETPEPLLEHYAAATSGTQKYPSSAIVA
jgi:hypothetical protein